MTLFGAMPLRSQLSDELFREYKDARFEKFLIENSKWATQASLVESMFRITNPTYASVNKTLLKYDRPAPSQLDPVIKKAAFRDVLNFFSSLINSCPIYDFHEVEYVPTSVPGWVFSKIFKCLDKQGSLAYFDYIKLFWERAHEEQYPVLFTQCGKVENLKKKKIDAQDIRGFTVAPFEFFVSKARMSQSLNKAMCSPDFHNFSPVKHGVNLMNGGFFDLLSKLVSVPNCVIGEGDATKWDSSSSREMLEICKEVRFHCWDKKGMSETEWWRRMNYYYDQIISSFVILPTGQVLQKQLGQPSGTTNTTDDNCIMHLFIWCYMWRKLQNRSLYSDFNKRVYLALYADDHVFSVDKGLNFHPFEVRKPIYEEFGVVLDPDKDLVSSDLEGHTFLGLKAKWNPQYRKYVPIFDANKAINVLMKNETKQVDVVALWSRAYSIAFLTCYDNQTHELARAYLHYLRKTEPILRDKYLPTQEGFRAHWHSKE